MDQLFPQSLTFFFSFFLFTLSLFSEDYYGDIDVKALARLGL